MGPARVRRGQTRQGNSGEEVISEPIGLPAIWARRPRSNIISLSLWQDQIFSNEGVHILPVKPNYGSIQYLCSPQGYGPVKIKHSSISRAPRLAGRLARMMMLSALVLVAGAALAQQPLTIEQIRVIGNRRIPKETVLARLFSHPGDT